MKVIIIFTLADAALGISAYYVLVRRYYWGAGTTRETIEKDKHEGQAKERDAR